MFDKKSIFQQIYNKLISKIYTIIKIVTINIIQMISRKNFKIFFPKVFYYVFSSKFLLEMRCHSFPAILFADYLVPNLIFPWLLLL